MPADEARHHLCRRERHFVHFHTDGLEKRRSRDVRMAADAGVPDADRLRLRFRLGDEISKRAPRRVRANGEDH
jgi:hypothetical protein